eukprot:COSAG01_NODE_4901_length_4641_cov_17.028181_7_plen_49_part_00
MTDSDERCRPAAAAAGRAGRARWLLGLPAWLLLPRPPPPMVASDSRAG